MSNISIHHPPTKTQSFNRPLSTLLDQAIEQETRATYEAEQHRHALQIAQKRAANARRIRRSLEELIWRKAGAS
jgi:hypothetical protein